MSQTISQQMPAAIDAPTFDLDLDGDSAAYKQSTLLLDGSVQARLRLACDRAERPVELVLLSVYSLLLAKVSGSDHLLLRVSDDAPSERLLRVEIDRAAPFALYVASMAELLASTAEGQSSSPQHVEQTALLPRFVRDAREANEIEPALTLQVKLTDGSTTLRCSARIRADREHVLAELLGSFVTLLEQVVDSWQVRIKQLCLVSGSARRRLLADFNQTDMPFVSRTIHEIFEEQAALAPTRLAVFDGKVSLTYGELNLRANQLAHRLRAHGIKPGDTCAILVSRSVQWCVALFGILKAGGAFVPLDPAQPEERVRFMLRDSGCRCIVASGSAAYDLPHFDLDDRTLSDEPTHDPALVNGVSDLAYVIYTSGTTGRPKGVQLCHEGIASFDRHYKNSFGFTPEDNVLNFFSPTFDGSISELTMALLAGTGFYLLPDEIKSSYRRFEQYLNEHHITVATIPPPYLSYLEPASFQTLHTIFVAGSASSKQLLDRWTRDFQVVNHYGPTEVTICASEWKAPRAEIATANVPIGQPIGNKKVYVVDRHGELMPLGLRGELAISGIRLSPGYLNLPELTAEKFVRNRFADELEGASGHDLLYRSGDWARWLPSGDLEFLGRIDSQVKIRGYRVELGEIEHAMLSLDGVIEAAVIVRADDAGENALYGFYAGSASEAEMRAQVSSRVPEYMVPGVLRHLSHLPRNSSDKVDKKQLDRLLELPSASGDGAAKLSQSQDDVGRAVLTMLGAIRDGVGADLEIRASDNLEQVGINSLRFIKLIMRIEEQFGLEFEGEFFVTRKDLTVGGLIAEARQRVQAQ
jgi:amino acid adenylation domain-containing protein